MSAEKTVIIAAKNFTSRLEGEVFRYKKGDKVTHKMSASQKKKYKEKGLIAEVVEA